MSHGWWSSSMSTVMRGAGERFCSSIAELRSARGGCTSSTNVGARVGRAGYSIVVAHHRSRPVSLELGREHPVSVQVVRRFVRPRSSRPTSPLKSVHWSALIVAEYRVCSTIAVNVSRAACATVTVIRIARRPRRSRGTCRVRAPRVSTKRVIARAAATVIVNPFFVL